MTEDRRWDGGDASRIEALEAEVERLRECHREAVALAERYRDEMDGYREALMEIADLHGRMHPVAGYMFDRNPAGIATKALA